MSRRLAIPMLAAAAALALSSAEAGASSIVSSTWDGSTWQMNVNDDSAANALYISQRSDINVGGTGALVAYDRSQFTDGSPVVAGAGCISVRDEGSPYNRVACRVGSKVRVVADEGGNSVQLANSGPTAVTAAASVIGGAGRDKFYGGAGPDSFYGGGDNDRLEGRDGNDRIAGGPGADSFVGGDGADWLVSRDDNGEADRGITCGDPKPSTTSFQFDVGFQPYYQDWADIEEADARKVSPTCENVAELPPPRAVVPAILEEDF